MHVLYSLYYFPLFWPASPAVPEQTMTAPAQSYKCTNLEGHTERRRKRKKGRDREADRQRHKDKESSQSLI